MKNTFSVRLYFKVGAAKVTTKTPFTNRASNKVFAHGSKNFKILVIRQRNIHLFLHTNP